MEGEKMSTTRSKAKATNATASRRCPDPVAGMEVLTLPEAAAFLRLAEEDVVRLVRDQALPGRHLGHEWRFLKAALQEWLRTPCAPPHRPGDLMQWAGAFRDDPDLPAIVAEAYRKRGRPMTEEGK
jgi:excisionase family DNA binding protein